VEGKVRQRVSQGRADGKEEEGEVVSVFLSLLRD